MNETDQTPPERLPVSVITGFLGSGKTTLLKYLLAHPDMGETAVVINEFGETGLDHLLVEPATDDTVLLSSGCLCCTVRGDLIDALRRLYRRRHKGEIPAFRRVVIETTGLADPAPILHTLMQDPVLTSVYRLDGIITTIDVVNGMSQMDRQMEPVKQAAVADRLLLTKCDLADDPAIAQIEARLRQLNPAAPILRVAQGVVEPSALFNAGLYNPETKSLDVQRWLHEEAYVEGHSHATDHAEHGHDHHHSHDHAHDHAHGLDVNRHDDHIRAFCVTRDEPLDWQRFCAWIDMLTATRGPDLLRMKGLLNVAGEAAPVAVHGVQHLFHPPVLLPAWPDTDRRSKIVLITRDIAPATIQESLDAFLSDAA
ncbi:GTP-binding protein [Dongia sp.]|uniref:CobW family GTP-binding protein n=1 Tax=Dongia sp. TaxID=1977262 RepID=UPI0035B07DC5